MAVDRGEVIMIYCIMTGVFLLILKLVDMAKRAWMRKKIADRMRWENRVRNQRGPQRPRNPRNPGRRGRRGPDHDASCPLRQTVRPTPPDIVTLANEITSNVFKRNASSSPFY